MEIRTYDPMQDFYQKAITFLFKQGIVAVICILFCLAMGGVIGTLWGRMERMEKNFEARIEANNQQWKMAIDTARQDWRNCEERRHELAVEVAILRAEVYKIKRKN